MRIAILLQAFFLSLLSAKPVFPQDVDSLFHVLNSAEKGKRVEIFQNDLGLIFNRTGAKQASNYLSKVLEFAEKTEDKGLLATVYYASGFICEKNFDDENAIGLYLKSQKAAKASDFKEQWLKTTVRLVSIYNKRKEWKKAEKQLKLAAEEQGPADQLAEIHKLRGDIALARKKYDDAQKYYSEAIETKIAGGDIPAAAAIAAGFGIALRSDARYENSLSYLRIALDLHRSLNDASLLANDYKELALTYFAQDNPRDALIYNQQAYQISLKNKSTPDLIEIEKNFALIFTKTGKINEAKSHLASAKNYLKGMQEGSYSPEIWEEIARLYRKMEEFELAYLAQVEYSKARESWLLNRKNAELYELDSRYSSKVKTKEQEQQIKILKAQQQNADVLRWFLLTCILLSIAIAAIYAYANHLKKRDNALLKAKNEAIENQQLALKAKNASLDILNQKLVDEIAEREALEKSSFEKDNFLAAISVKMATPLNSIVGLTHLLLENHPRQDQRAPLKNLQFAANNLVVFINDILDFSKIEAGKLTLDTGEFSLKQVFNDLREQFEAETEQLNIQLGFSYNRQIPARLYGDPGRLTQILTNLINASIQQTPEGKIDIFFEKSDDSHRRFMLYFEIRDNGKKLQPQVLEAVFQPAGDEVIFDRQKNTIFGLTIARRLIELQNGRLEIETLPNSGNCFKGWIPFQKIEKSDNPDGPSLTRKEKLAGNKVLLVEDNRINQLVVVNLLNQYGMEVTTAGDGLEALDTLAAQAFDIILMDIQMPKMDGYRTTTEIRKMTDPAKRAIPIIALTASAFLTHEEKAKLFGMDDYVGKPFSPQELLEKIDLQLRIKK